METECKPRILFVDDIVHANELSMSRGDGKIFNVVENKQECEGRKFDLTNWNNHTYFFISPATIRSLIPKSCMLKI
jgi:hypothetical protein